ncbi:alpha/beta hydrolase [Caulobacter sp. KR2-114]|uniref:alpha/beta hydrolase n=1 Tax=Caulobacter sp. KR2-114 TaxID=3400912 RepID=UPI003C0A2FD1
MIVPPPATGTRRPELQQAFQHLTDYAEAVDLTGINDPAQQWLAQVRTTVPIYTAVGAPVDLDDVTFTPVLAAGVPSEWATVAGSDPDRRLVYFHGGGWAAGSPLSHRVITGILARLTGMSVLVADYRLAPEHPYPAPLDDCVAAYRWAIDNGPHGAGEARKMTVAGDSAGGNLSAATCVRLASTGGRMPDRLALIAATLDQVSMWDRVGTDDLICTDQSLGYSVELYLTPAHGPAHPEVSPAFAPAALLKQFPPTLLQVSAAEALAFDSKRFADRLEKAHVRVNLSLWPDVPHVWQGMVGLFPEAAEALAEIADFLKR